jgi:ferric-dicitrate binding protein FerR (iron transport regulator)
MAGRGVWATLTLLLLTSISGFAAGRPNDPRAVGYLAVSGEVWVDHQVAPTGTAVFTGDSIATGKGSAAEVRLASGASATLSENGELTLAPDAGSPTLRLTKGAVAVRHPGGDAARVQVPGATIVVQGESGFPALCRIASAGSAASVIADRGRIEVHGKGAPQLLRPGKSMRLEAGMPQAAGQTAGKVSNQIPRGTVQHPGQVTPVSLNLNDNIVWDDVVRTLENGRVRIALLDGTFLNVGVRSMMRIVRHDAQSQQTEIELQLGRLRGQVVKLSKPGASFQIKTNTAVIGVVGTILMVTATRNSTHVRCLEGMVSVKSSNPAIPGETHLGPGQQTSVGQGQPPSGATPSAPNEVAQELNLTNAGEVPSPELARLGEIGQVGRAAPPVPSAATSAGQAGGTSIGTSSALNVASVAAGAASAGVSGVAVSRAGDARNQAAEANATASQAESVSQSAAAAASSAGDAATAFGNGVQGFIEQLSPGGGGCKCLP